MNWASQLLYFVERSELLATSKASKMFSALLKYFSRWIISRASARNLWKIPRLLRFVCSMLKTMGWYHEKWNGQPCFWFLLKCDSNVQQYSTVSAVSFILKSSCLQRKPLYSETKSPHNRLLWLYWWMYQQPESGHFLHREGWSFPCNWSAESSKKKIIANACAGQWDVFLFHMWQVSQN